MFPGRLTFSLYMKEQAPWVLKGEKEIVYLPCVIPIMTNIKNVTISFHNAFLVYSIRSLYMYDLLNNMHLSGTWFWLKNEFIDRKKGWRTTKIKETINSFKNNPTADSVGTTLFRRRLTMMCPLGRHVGREKGNWDVRKIILRQNKIATFAPKKYQGVNYCTKSCCKSKIKTNVKTKKKHQ